MEENNDNNNKDDEMSSNNESQVVERNNNNKPPAQTQNGGNSSEQQEQELQDFLDRPFFVPEKVDDKSPLKWFANLVENDYQTAEALFASLFITGMVIVTQEVLRMQLYGPDNYIPFSKGGGGGGFLFWKKKEGEQKPPNPNGARSRVCMCQLIEGIFVVDVDDDDDEPAITKCSS